jgi:signal transduction histidine kinase
VLFSRRVTRPLTALQTASEKIADGEYTQRTQVKTDDEIGALSRSFDAMAAAVEGKINELSKTTQSQQDFIAAFTHEVKTPMTAMLGYADLMRARPDDAETQREAAGYIYHETQRLENLSRSLLALMGLDQTGALELVLCQDAGLLLQTVRSLPQGSTPVPRVISAGCVVQVDRSLWVDMLRNLTLNAQRACQGIEGAAITLRCERRAGQAVFTVTDTGCGIPAADLPRVTEAFYMVDKSRSRAAGGSGIGLALCARIAGAHGAKLEITSTEHVGTTVTIAVPEVLPSEREADNDTQS